MATVTVKKEIIISSLSLLCGVIVLGIMMFLGCFNKNQQPATVTTETNKSDTATIPVINVNVPPSHPEPASTEIKYIPQPYQQASDIQGLIKQNNDLMEKYTEAMTTLTSVLRYNEQIALTDSNGHQVGTFKYGDVVTGNKIVERKPSYSIDQKVITNTKTITIDHPYEPRVQVFAGAEIGGNQSYFLNDVAAGFILKNKKDQLFKANVTYDLHNNPLTPQRGLGARVGFYPLISFRKK